jgi:membrane-associated phospholipid phosphatase
MFPPEILQWGISVILGIQSLINPTLTTFVYAINFTGTENFYIVALCVFFWCLDRRTGARLMFLFVLSAFLNAIVKVWAGQPRPFQYDSRVQELFEAPGFGFPSQHTQYTVVVWGLLAIRFRRAWLWALAGVLLVFVPLSRLYLGVHFPTDLLGGYVFGAVLLPLFLWLAPGAAATRAREAGPGH